MAYTGRCACGAVTATIAADAPVAVRQCWCRQCQKIAGGWGTTNAMFATADVAIEGDLATHRYIAASGNELTQSFCPKCGTPVMGQVASRPHFRTLRVGFIDLPHDLRPQMAIWTSEAPAFALFDPEIEHFAAQPPAPPPPAPPPAATSTGA